MTVNIMVIHIQTFERKQRLFIVIHKFYLILFQFFGLILEGRQSSRRRNSRGHAYRRLDTLEQAMSANTAAPPSKIIY